MMRRLLVAVRRRPGEGDGTLSASARMCGFTLIELVSVIVILGTLAVIALPRFINLQEEAERAALEGVAGAAGSAQALNLSAALAEDGDAEPMPDCRDTSTLMQGGRPAGYRFVPRDLDGPIGASATCTVQHLETGDTAIFTAYFVSS